MSAFIAGRYGRFELLLHDAATHERYGRARATSARGSEYPALEYGPLLVDCWRREATIRGAMVALTRREWATLEYLARRRGRWCSTVELARAVWDDFTNPHTLHVYIARLRARLGPYAWLVENRKGYGYRLRSAPPRDADQPRYVALGSWARAWAGCVCCGRTDRPHAEHGRCERCRGRADHRSPHYGPCGRPPAIQEDA